ncbi:uncharacterized protein H6S33_001323 [Morchella sextelata]|uniref:uncharacterized protein n=1 Tax=Morchella sextelata TaxID=1174677 RepID=UPI001D03DEBD|nr:uncharacterized protein H6S33_001323 [Morchella sextelata]KAH0609095.1 hypothetical protein H6S33_001323 [Morchella sextelata]
MDSPFVSSLFRSLFHRRAHLRLRAGLNGYSQRRNLMGFKLPVAPDSDKNTWQPRSTFLQRDRSEEYERYPMVTAQQLATRTERPKRVKMLVRDFIDDSLYNPNYGYFSKYAVIFSTPHAFNFPALVDESDFQRNLGEAYTAFEDALDATHPSDIRQLWHTPTELFKPYYGEAISRYLVENYKLSLFPYNDLIIYEMGAGNGTMMSNILDHIRNTDPDVYARTKYRIIEISPSLAELQSIQASQGPHADKIEIMNKSIFDWDTYVPDPCFFLALEVFDNFSHDMIRYDPETERALQGIVMIDKQGDFHEFYTPHLDPVAERFLKIRSRVARPGFQHPLRTPKIIRKLREALPFTPNLSKPEFIPTKMMGFFDVLRENFPAHKLLMSDFHALPDAVEGVNAPVVQTRYKRTSIPVSTPFVQQGLFDILFPTDFDVMDDMYKALTGRLTRVMKHEEFLKSWAFLEETETQSGDNPMLNWYKNASVMSSV